MYNTQIKNSDFFPVKSPEYQAFLKTGFKFENLKLEGNMVVGKLHCICGKIEIFRRVITKPLTLKENGKAIFDYLINQFIHDDEHLIEDGYTPEQITEIRTKYKINLGDDDDKS